MSGSVRDRSFGHMSEFSGLNLGRHVTIQSIDGGFEFRAQKVTGRI